MTFDRFQKWTAEQDRQTGWDKLTTPQLACHLAEEVGELIRSMNRTLEYEGEVRDEHVENIKMELVDSVWFLVKIANRYDVDLESAVTEFSDRASGWPPEKHGSKLRNGLAAIRREISEAD